MRTESHRQERDEEAKVTEEGVKRFFRKIRVGYWPKENAFGGIVSIGEDGIKRHVSYSTRKDGTLLFTENPRMSPEEKMGILVSHFCYSYNMVNKQVEKLKNPEGKNATKREFLDIFKKRANGETRVAALEYNSVLFVHLRKIINIDNSKMFLFFSENPMDENDSKLTLIVPGYHTIAVEYTIEGDFVLKRSYKVVGKFVEDMKEMKLFISLHMGEAGHFDVKKEQVTQGEILGIDALLAPPSSPYRRTDPSSSTATN